MKNRTIPAVMLVCGIGAAAVAGAVGSTVYIGGYGSASGSTAEAADEGSLPEESVWAETTAEPSEDLLPEEWPSGEAAEMIAGESGELPPENVPDAPPEDLPPEERPWQDAPEGEAEESFEDWEVETYSDQGETEEAESIRNTEKNSTVEDFEILGKEDAVQAFDLLEYEELPSFFYLDVPEVLQKPELPTGCESVALTMALQYEGFELSKTTIATEFLIYNRETDNLALGYIGDPFSEEGAGCFAPAIAATADDFFADQQLPYAAYDITDSTMEELLSYVAAGTPVIVWSTMYMAEPEFTREDSEYNGKTYRWYTQEHCVVLSGYDLEASTLQINDPLEGIVTRDLEEFKRIYNLTGQNAVVLKENAAEE